MLYATNSSFFAVTELPLCVLVSRFSNYIVDFTRKYCKKRSFIENYYKCNSHEEDYKLIHGPRFSPVGFNLCHVRASRFSRKVSGSGKHFHRHTQGPYSSLNLPIKVVRNGLSWE